MDPLRARRPKFNGEKFLKFRCTECGNCCSDTIVPITHEDVARMMKGTGLKAMDIATFYKSSDFDDGGEGLQFVNLDGGRRTLGLRKRFDKENDRDSCAFFKGDRCSVYEHRPVTCRVWPFTLRFDPQRQARQPSQHQPRPALPLRAGRPQHPARDGGHLALGRPAG